MKKLITIILFISCFTYCSGQKGADTLLYFGDTDKDTLSFNSGYSRLGSFDYNPVYFCKGDTIPKDSVIYLSWDGIMVDIIPIKAGKGIIMSDTIINGIAVKVFTVDTSYKVETDTIPFVNIPYYAPEQNIKWEDTVYTDTADPNKYQRGGWTDHDSNGKVIDSVRTYFLLPDFELVNKYVIYSYRNVPEFGVYYYEGVVSRAEEWDVFKSAVLFNRELMFEYVELRYHYGGSFATHYINRKLIDKVIKKY